MDRNVKNRVQRVGQPDSFTARNESALQSPAAGHPDSIRSSSTKKIAAATVDSAHDGHSLSGIVDVILEVGQQRNALIAELRAALQSGKDGDALILARRLCGL
jgi:hypothetical protein